jgi:hypothetical protein
VNRGACLDALNPGGCPPAAELAGRLQWARLVAFTDPAFYAYHDALQAAGIRTAVVLAGETFDGRDWAQIADDLAERVQPDVWVVGNEEDAYLLDAPSDSSWAMAPAEYAQLWMACEVAIRAVHSDATIILGGFVAGQPSVLTTYLGAIAAVWPGEQIDGVDVHPYGKTADETRALLQGYRRAGNLPRYVLEWNRPAEEIAAYQAMLDAETAGSTWFAWSDQMVDGFGLVAVDGTLTPEGRAFFTEEESEMSAFHFGFKAYADAHPEVGTPVGDEEYVSAGYSQQMTSNGMLVYSKAANQVRFLSFA